MIARDLLSPICDTSGAAGLPEVAAEATLFDVVAAVAASADGRVAVRQDGVVSGVIDAPQVVKALAQTTASRDDCSVIVVECHPDDYSASLLAHAVEDADAHLTDLLTAPAADGINLTVTMRVRLRDPQGAIHSLERYGFRVVDARGITDGLPTVMEERLAALQLFLNV